LTVRRLGRAAFLTTGAATLLASCGRGGGGSSLLPGTSSAQSRPRAAETLTPADPIPAYVLAYPIIGEAWRFDGSVAPPGWIPLDGRTLTTANNRALAGIVDNEHAAQSTTFAVPKAAGWIVAVNGTAPTSPRVFTLLHRGEHPNHGVSVPGLTVSDAPAAAPRAPVAEPALPTWYPGTFATPAQLNNQYQTTTAPPTLPH